MSRMVVDVPERFREAAELRSAELYDLPEGVKDMLSQGFSRRQVVAVLEAKGWDRHFAFWLIGEVRNGDGDVYLCTETRPDSRAALLARKKRLRAKAAFKLVNAFLGLGVVGLASTAMDLGGLAAIGAIVPMWMYHMGFADIAESKGHSRLIAVCAWCGPPAWLLFVLMPDNFGALPASAAQTS